MNTTKETKIPGYIANALIILTAHQLGVDVEMLSLAETTWKTKGLSEPTLLARFSEAARNAQEQILAQNLGTKADRFALALYQTHKFPDE